MYVCMYVCMHACMYACIYACMYNNVEAVSPLSLSCMCVSYTLLLNEYQRCICMYEYVCIRTRGHPTVTYPLAVDLPSSGCRPCRELLGPATLFLCILRVVAAAV